MKHRSQVKFLVAIIVAIGCNANFLGVKAEEGIFSTLDHDYYTAQESVETARLLELVEVHHFSDKTMFDKFRRGMYEPALGDIKYALERFPNHPKILNFLEYYAEVVKVPEIPLVYYERAIKLFPQHGLTYAQYGYYLSKIGRGNEGIAELEKAVKVDPKLLLAHEWLAETYEKQGRKELARRARESAVGLGLKPTKGERQKK